MVEFGIKRQRADRQQDERDVRIHNERQYLLLQRHIVRQDWFARELQGNGLSVETLDGMGVNLLEQIVFVGGDVVDEFLGQSFLISKRLGFANGGFRYSGISAPLGNHGSHERSRIIFDFLLHDVVYLASSQGDGVGSAGIGARRHGGHVCGLKDEKSRRTSTATAGSDIDNDGHGRGQNLFHDVARGVE